MNKTRVLVLSSVSPNFSHFRAAQTVLAYLLEELAASGFDVSYAVAELKSSMDAISEDKLRGSGIELVPNPSAAMKSIPLAGRLTRSLELAHQMVDPKAGRDDPEFAEPHVEVARLLSSGASAGILFWDTFYEQLVPELAARGLPIFGYLARPPFASAQTTAQDKLSGLRKQVEAVRLRARERRHFGRLRHLAGARNICALDAAWYARENVACSYLPNTWPDPFGDKWEALRAAAESRRDGIHMLGNIGGLNATGNRYGMAYFAEKVLPLLDGPLKNKDWTVNICGRFELPAELEPLARHPRVALRGFVPDIDEEIAGNHLFLLLNNAGPYTGGYTRVIYAFATGACVIAHARLAESMPELVGNENCLLGETPDQIASLILRAASDRALRSRIGAAARRTYVGCYRPSRVAEGLRDMVREHLH